MNYTTREQRYADNLEEIFQTIPPEFHDKIWIGNGIWNQSYQNFEKKTELARSLNFQHYVLFSYNVLKADKNYFESIKIFNRKEYK
jgi:hypothetical protein